VRGPRVCLRGEVYWVDFTSAGGGEIGKVRPAAVVSNDTANRFLNRVQIVPLTSNTARVYPSEALVTVNGVEHKALADKIATATKERVGDPIGRLSPADLRGVERAIQRQLGLPLSL
jgi:mRNA interferase MazF